jgi:ABC-type amino acid transport system permease subunit
MASVDTNMNAAIQRPPKSVAAVVARLRARLQAGISKNPQCASLLERLDYFTAAFQAELEHKGVIGEDRHQRLAALTAQLEAAYDDAY